MPSERRRSSPSSVAARLKAASDLAKQRAPYRWRFMLYPVGWQAYGYKHNLKWLTVRFEKANRLKIPDKPGVYAFLVQPNVGGILNVSYLFYVGETVSLRNRFGDYLRESAGSDNSRIQLYVLFNEYQGHVLFTYALLPKAHRKQVERELLAALTPPLNKKLPATIAAAERAFQ